MTHLHVIWVAVPLHGRQIQDSLMMVVVQVDDQRSNQGN